jgi:hypothetical protein
MRLLLGLGCLLLAGCTGPHSTGGLWAQENLEREAALFRLTDAQRAEGASAFELSVADESLAAERSRVEAALSDCPGDRRALAISSGDKVRDTVRLRAQADTARLAAVAQIALADWRIRRGQASGDTQFCEAARAALTTPLTASSDGTLLASLGEATVTRDPRQPGSPVAGDGDPHEPFSAAADDPLVALSLYAMESVDTVRAAAPLPQYLAAVYGGQVSAGGAASDLGGRPPAAIVDDLAPAYPDWEPDALYAALSAQ